MTGAAAPGVAFRDRLVAERTRMLARRGLAGTEGVAAASDRLVCVAGPRLVALPPGLVARVLATAFEPVPLITPAASRVMLGMSVHNGLPHSLLELAGLLAPAEAGAGGAGGLMLLLRGRGRRVALRVDAVLGTPALRPAGDGRHALLPDDRLALLLDAAALHAAIDALDDPQGIDAPDDPAGEPPASRS